MAAVSGSQISSGKAWHRRHRRSEGNLGSAIQKSGVLLLIFKMLFTAKAVGHFGSGWAWLVVNQKGELEIVDT
jgi:superoxide dismutase